MRTRARWAAPWVAALILAGVAPRLSAYQGGSTAALKMSVTILPFLQGAGGSQTPPSVTGDDDGYGVAAARIKARGQGPSAVLAAALNSNGRLVAYSSSGKPEAEAPLQAQACVMVFEHRPARAPAKGQEAVVELAVRVSATSGNAELFTDFYRASMPAKGPFSKQAAAYLLHHGISNYRNTPLGKAFFKAVQNSISGAPEPEQRAQNFGIVPGIGRVVWQARVTGKQGSAYVINAGGKNGLKAGQSLLPYQVRLTKISRSGQSLSGYQPLTGGLKIASVSPSTALLSGQVNSLAAGAAVLAQKVGSALAARSVAYVEGSAPRELREAFLQSLTDLLDAQEQARTLKKDQLHLKGTCHLEKEGDRGERLKVDLELLDSADGKVLAHHRLEGAPTNYVQMADQFQKVFLRQIQQRWPQPGDAREPQPLARIQAARWANAARLRAAAGSPPFRLGLEFTSASRAPADAPVYQDGDAVELRCSSERDCFAVIYNVDPAGELQRLWPARPGRPGFLRAGQKLELPEAGAPPLRVFGNLGQESVVALAWETELPGRKLLEANPGDIDDLVRALVDGALQGGSLKFSSAEPGGTVPLAGFPEAVRADALRLGATYSGSYALTPLDYYTEPRAR